MTSEFIPGKAYLIKGKGIEQVKSEIKEWLAKNDIEMLMESEDIIEAHDYGFLYYYNFYFLVKLVEIPEGTFVVFSDKISKNIFFIRNCFEPLTSLLDEQRRDMIRFLNGKMELNVSLRSFARIVNFTYLPISLTLMLLIFFIDFYYLWWISMPIGLLWAIFYFAILPWTMTKNKNLPEYKVEEYKGEIEID